MPTIPQLPVPNPTQSGVTQWPPWQALPPWQYSRQWLSSQPPRGLLDQRPDITPMLEGSNRARGTYGLLAQDVADIIKLYGKGGLNPYTEMRDPGTGGGRGLLGSQWRNPEFIQQYEVRQGLKPGSLQTPSASVTNIAPPGGRQFDFGKYNEKATDPRMLAQDALTKAREQRAIRSEKGLSPVTGPRSVQEIEADIAKVKQRNRGAPSFGDWAATHAGPDWRQKLNSGSVQRADGCVQADIRKWSHDQEENDQDAEIGEVCVPRDQAEPAQGGDAHHRRQRHRGWT